MPETKSIEFQVGVENLSASHLDGFCVGWSNPLGGGKLLTVLKSSYRSIFAVDKSTGQVVGFINAISDGHLSAYIPLLEVRPEWQGKGIGADLVRRMIVELADIYMVDLCCDPELQPFYSKLGFMQLQGMGHRNFESEFLRA